MAKKTDKCLIAASIKGDHQAYGELVELYKDALYRHCFAIVRDECVAEDISQDTFIDAYYKISTYDDTYAFSTWLFKIGTNKALNWFRSNKRIVNVDEDAICNIPSKLPSPLEESLYDEVRLAVRRLPSNYQAVISLFYWQGYQYKDIAAIMDVPEGTVKGWLKRAKDALRKDLS